MAGYAMDEIRIEGLEVFARHGVYPEETKLGQRFVVNAVLYTDTQRAGKTDELAYSTDYGGVSLFIQHWMQEHTCKLLEAVAERLAEAILLKYELITAVELEIRKPQAPIPLSFQNVSVRIYRARHKAYLSVGSNLGDREGYLNGALAALRENPLIQVKKCSELIETKAYGGVEQGDFLNGALEIETLLTPEALLETLHEIENAAGRVRVQRWGPRTLDLDILFYDKLVYESETLILPHPDLENREFVLQPMTAIAPYYRHPLSGKTMEQLLTKLRQTQLCIGEGSGKACEKSGEDTAEGKKGKV